jgi:penicillin-binding protein 1C
MKRRLKICLWLSGAMLLPGIGIWLAGPWLFPPPERALAAQGPSRLYLDRHGEPFRVEPGWDYEWRLPVPLSAISPHLVRATLEVEDRRFYEHGGIDWLGVARALRSDLTTGRVISGASTIPMQLARIADPQPRSLWSKFRQACQARGLERRHDKAWILEEYLNRLPYGGKIVGIEAAARYYFGRPAADLNQAEASLLAGLPQRPNALRPDRHPKAARTRQWVVLRMLERQGAIGPGEAARIFRDEPLRYRDFSKKTSSAASPLGFPCREPQFCALARQRAGDACRIRTTLDQEWQGLTEAALREQLARLPGVGSAAAVVIDNRSGTVRALIGTLDFAAVPAGQVNVAISPRSPGSALKPFIYAEAMDGGLLVPETVLTDAPLILAGYRPGNFDGDFRGRITATDALASSLNTPAIRLLAEVKPARVLETLEKCGVKAAHGDRSAQTGLTLALGGLEVTLLDLTNAYAGLARGGRFFPCQFVEGVSSDREFRPWAPGTVSLLTQMLRSRPMPAAGGLEVAWKTGTSNGNRDAWCFAWTPEVTVGIWFGNKNGSPAAALVGSGAAAPAAGALLQALYRNGAAPAWPANPPGITQVSLCAVTGLRAGPACQNIHAGEAIAGVPLRSCPQCARLTLPSTDRPAPSTSARESTRILMPVPGTYVAGENQTVRLRLLAAPGAHHWYADGRYLGLKDGDAWIELVKGRHRLLAVPAKDSGAGETVEVLVK